MPHTTLLCERIRNGDNGAFETLYRENFASAMSVAKRRAGSDAEDVVSEAFTRVYRLMSGGGGPNGRFRPYLLQTVCNVATDRARREGRTRPTDWSDLEDTPELLVAPYDLVEVFDRELATRAFEALPQRWRKVLWLYDVEGLSRPEVAYVLGIDHNAVSALARRAREGLRQRFLALHAVRIEHPDCVDHRDLLASFVRARLSNAQRERVELHLQSCARCSEAVDLLWQTNACIAA